VLKSVKVLGLTAFSFKGPAFGMVKAAFGFGGPANEDGKEEL
jgi:hypothetical protein